MKCIPFYAWLVINTSVLFGHETPCQLYVCMYIRYILIMNVHSTCRSRAKNVGDKIRKL